MARKLTHRYNWAGYTPSEEDIIKDEDIELEDEDEPSFRSTGWFLVAAGRNGLGEPVVCGLYGPFATEAAAEDFGGYVYEPGDTLFVAEAGNPIDIAAYNCKYEIIEE